MMTEQEFIVALLDKHWVNRGDTLDGADCYGVVKLYKELVQGISLPVVEGYKKGHQFDVLWSQEIDKVWRQVGRWQKGAMITFYNHANEPVHVGICIGKQQVLHSNGSDEKGGKVTINKLAAMLSLPQYAKATYHEIANA